MMFSKDLKRLSFDTIIPFDKDDLLLIANPYLAFRLTNMVDDNNNYFSIKSIMLDNTVFACMDFNKRCSEFAKIMEARIERYFVTKKVPYIFFDDEEQSFLKTLIRKNTLTAGVIIYTREDTQDTFKEIEYTDMNHKQYMEVSKYLRRLRVAAVIKPEIYYSMYATTKRDAKEKFEKLRKNKDKEFMQKMYEKYPKLKEVRTKDQYKTYYRGLTKKYHPDAPNGNNDIFTEIGLDFESLKETYWYRSLISDVEDETQQQQDGKSEEANILIQSSREAGCRT
jgi:hypothetical protein